MTAAHEPLVFSPMDLSVQADPYPFFARLREEAPVYFIAELDMWAVARHADVKAALHDFETFSSQIGKGAGARRGTSKEVKYGKAKTMISLDPPDATRLRRLVSREFTPRAVTRWTPRIEAIAEELADQLIEAGATSSAELMSQFAIPLPTMVIAEILGVPTADRETFKRWSDDLLSSTFLTAQSAGAAARANVELQAYFGAMVDEKAKAPSDDLISLLVRAHDGDAALTRDEIVAHCILFLVGGNETTANLIGNALIALDRFPTELRRVEQDPDLVASVVEETLRYDSPVLGVGRVTTRAVEIAGVTLPAGSSVLLLVAAANHDERVYVDPHRFDIDRDARSHLAFGGGPHYCVGASLGRAEAEIGLRSLFSKVEELSVSSEPTINPNLYLRGRSAVPVSFTAKPRTKGPVR